MIAVPLTRVPISRYQRRAKMPITDDGLLRSVTDVGRGGDGGREARSVADCSADQVSRARAA